jgi:peptide/nickel transport system ATP-binding protein
LRRLQPCHDEFVPPIAFLSPPKIFSRLIALCSNRHDDLFSRSTNNIPKSSESLLNQGVSLAEAAAEPQAIPRQEILEIDDLRTHFFTPAGVVRAVDGVSYAVRSGETLGIVGESGCGKSVTALSILRLVANPPGRIVGGAVRFGGTNLLELSERAMEGIRGNDISMIFQEPMTSLNPLLTVGRQISEVIALHQGLPPREAMEKAIEMLRRVSIPEPQRRAQAYPHHLSGGMRQRVMIAMALSCNPKVLIADEPTTALDVTIQAQILDLMRELQESFGTAIMLITHDMGVVAENADRVVVMYAGRKVEEASAETLFQTPGHPYTRGLLGSIPKLDAAARAETHRSRLNEIKGMVPSLHNLPQGCTFAPRCEFATDTCRAAYPPLVEQRPRHVIACWHADRVLAEAS